MREIKNKTVSLYLSEYRHNQDFCICKWLLLLYKDINLTVGSSINQNFPDG